MTAAIQDVRDALLLTVVEWMQLQHLGKAENGVERGAQLMAHGGEKMGFGLVGLLSQLLCQLQLLVLAQERCDIAYDTDKMGLAILLYYRGDIEFNGNGGTLFGDRLKLTIAAEDLFAEDMAV